MIGEEQIRAIIEERRSFHGPEGFDYREDAEAEARQFLDEHAGSMTPEQATQLGSLFNKDFAKGREYRARFAPAFHGATMNRLIEDLGRFNDFTRRIWRVQTDDEALNVVGEIIEDPTVLPGGGRSYPTMLMYLRSSGRWPVWIDATHRGLRAATDFDGPGRKGGREAYERFAGSAINFAEQYGLRPQELDSVLTEIGRRATKSVAAQKHARKQREPPKFTSDTFQFLAELQENNDQAWMEINRNRFRRSVKAPFRLLMQALADEYIQALDPQIDTQVKFGHVMAGIRKRFPDEEGEYWSHYWGSFSRGKKQEDVQLYVTVKPDKVGFGFGFGSYSAQPEHLANLRHACQERAEILWTAVNEVRGTLLFATREGADVAVSEPKDLEAWSLGESPQIVREVSANDPLATSPELLPEIGKVLRALHPFAKAAWGDELDEGLVLDDGDEELEDEEEYTFEQLEAETFLPSSVLEEWITLLQDENRRQAILYGPPGTGKTWIAQRLAKYLAREAGKVKTVQFHPSFSYEDFLEGLRPEPKDGAITYAIRPGVFADFCDEARSKESTYVFVIDEINRADLGSVLGELMLLLEYREDVKVPLPYSGRQFSVPRNVVVLSTMNTADRSLALVDYALRRRFHAIEMPPDKDVLATYLRSVGEPSDSVVMKFFELIQEQISDPSYAPGHSYWMADDLSLAGLQLIWKYELRPYLAEYWFEDEKRLDRLDEEVNALLAEES